MISAKALKVQIDGVPYLMVEMNFRKPGKGNALYECKMKNLVRGTMLDRTYRAGQTLEGADVSEFDAQYPVPPAGHVCVHEQRATTSSTSSRPSRWATPGSS